MRYHDSRYIKVLRMLKEYNGYISGEHISNILGVSRVSVWKYISLLRSKYGYVIDAKPRGGYKLLSIPDRLLPWEIMERLEGKSRMVKDILYYDEVSSTQDIASRLAEQGKHSLLVVAEKQLKGKGRLARRWISPYGGIWFSLVAKPDIHISSVSMLSLASALAVCNAINSNYNLNARIKWPNDVIINYRKVAGILVDASIEQDEMHYAIIGIGINANVSKDTIEKGIADYAREGSDEGYYAYGYGLTTLMHELNMKVDRVRLLADTITWFESIYDMLKHNKAEFIEEVKRHMVLGKVHVVSREERMEGYAIGIDEDDGSLLINYEGRIRKVVAGDVYIRYSI
jgi:BirA family biotin operon repressor/biotin-[acetyl-CoA-carboxylase] ligase